ncbi:MAG: redoxin domain-containing protein [Geminicoccaceae bacterium]
MSTIKTHPPAPDLQVMRWFNTDASITLAGLRGKVVVIEAFQMLCPGCVAHGLPQAAAIAETFVDDDVVVMGLHTVFEHHDAMPPIALEAFLHEYRIRFPVGVDQPADPEEGPVPKTMQAYQLRGTPSLLVIDRAGRLRINHFGQASDMRVAVEISRLLYEAVPTPDHAFETHAEPSTVCTPAGCTA